MTAVVLCCTDAQAALGDVPQSGRPGSAVPGAAVWQQTSLAGSSSTVSSAVLASGTTLREWTNAAGQVFAVSWTGPLLPDLAALLGDAFADYQEAVRLQHVAGFRGAVIQVQKAGLVLVSRGRMGQFEGHAYRPALVPADVNIKALWP